MLVIPTDTKLTLMEWIGVASKGDPVSLKILCFSLIFTDPFIVLVAIGLFVFLC